MVLTLFFEMKSRLRRILSGVLLIIIALVIGFGIAVWVRLARTLPPTDGAVALAGLDGPIDITFDSMGVAQVWAETEHDAMFGLGWLHAADRMFQLDFNRRVAQGRLSELLGESTVEFDMDRRRDGHSRLAQEAPASFSAEDRTMLRAYADGINAYRRHGGSTPLEYLLLQASFEDWRVFDCLTVLSFMTWYSDALQNRDGFYATLVREGYGEALQKLPLEYPLWAPMTVLRQQAASIHDAAGNWQSPVEAMVQSVTGSGPQAFTAARSSNAWTVGPGRSESGAAIFCSDPHLEISRLPQFWYAVGIHVRESALDAVGITIPGLPFIVMGHNSKAAWAFTAAGVDVVDYYMERVNPEDSSLYLTRIDQSQGDDSLIWEEIRVIYDTVAIAGVDTGAAFTIRLTRHGPVVPEWSRGDTLYTRRWAGQDADLYAAITAGARLMYSDEFGEFRRTVTAMGALNANWMYADRGGTIGYQLGSPVPRRNGVSPYVPVAGWWPENDWDGYLLLDDKPWAENPSAGWLANCNNKSGAESDIPGTYAVDRILRISQLLQTPERFSVEDMRRFQLDRFDVYRLRWKGLVDSVGVTLADTAGVIRAVANWDGMADTASHAVGLMVVFLDRLTTEVFADELVSQAEGIGITTLDQVFFGGDSGWIDDRTTPEVEGRYEIARRALGQAVEVVNGQQWGEMQKLQMAHPMAKVPILGSLIDLRFGPWPQGGTSGTLNSSFHEQAGRGQYRSIVGPSWRFIVDFANVDEAVMVLPGGNSGNPLSSHFFDFNGLWRNGEYWNVPISRERVFERAVSVLRLEPEAGSVDAE